MVCSVRSYGMPNAVGDAAPRTEAAALTRVGLGHANERVLTGAAWMQYWCPRREARPHRQDNRQS
eukprot:359613-Chlamydomonas_euryale.AAC.5